MSEDSYHPPPIAVPIPQSSDIRTYYFNWCFTHSLSHSSSHLNIRHIRHYHPFINFTISPTVITQCSGTHHFEFLSPSHSFPILVVQFTILPLLFTFSPLTFTSPSTTYSCPIVHVFWHDLPFFPPNQDLDALELPTDEDIHLDFIKDFLKSFIDLYYSTLHPFTTPLEYKA